MEGGYHGSADHKGHGPVTVRSPSCQRAGMMFATAEFKSASNHWSESQHTSGDKGDCRIIQCSEV